MTSRERFLAVLHREKPDRVPMDYRATHEVDVMLMKHLGCEDMFGVYKKLHIDPVIDLEPKYCGSPIPEDRDPFGIRYENTDYGLGQYRNPVFYPLAKFNTIEELEKKYTWPSPDWYDFSCLEKMVNGKEECVFRCFGSEPFGYYKYLRGVEQGYIDLIENKAFISHCLVKLYDIAYEMTRRIYETVPGKVIWTWVAEDVGSQEGLLCSLDIIKELFIPHMKRMVDLVHQAGSYAFHHSDGAVFENIPNIIGIDMDVLDPVQWRCKGMDRQRLKDTFGDQIIFHGAMDNQQTLAFGTVADVRQEVEENLRILGHNGGYLLGPCHNLQAVSPVENIIAMYETGYVLGKC